jgi:hypothetical protein
MNTSRRILLTAVAALVLILIAGGVFLYGVFFNSPPSPSSSPSAGNPFGFLFPNNEQNGNPSSAPNETGTGSQKPLAIEVLAKDGTQVQVKDLTKDADAMTNPSDQSYYFFPPAGTATTTFDTADYHLTYFEFDKSFLVSILAEPLGEIRRSASADLANRLGVSEKDLCNLIIVVSVPRDVNSYFIGMDLGLPGCPEAYRFDGDPKL